MQELPPTYDGKLESDPGITASTCHTGGYCAYGLYRGHEDPRVGNDKGEHMVDAPPPTFWDLRDAME